MTASTSGTAPAWSLPRLAFYHIFPGLASLLVFTLSAWLVRDSWIPNMAMLYVAILLGEVPVTWYLIHRALKREGKSLALEHILPWREPIRKRVLWGVGIPIAIAGMILIFGVAAPFEPMIRGTLFSWVPDWFVLQAGPDGMASMTREALLLVWILAGIGGTLIGGLSQEIYHRGFLLPRAAHFGWVSVPINAALFAMMHLQAPWGWPFFFLGSVVWAAAVYKWRNVWIGVVGHVGMLTIGWLGMTAQLFLTV